jgi:hypothetical protein
MSHSLSKLLLLYAQQFEDQHAPQNMTLALREAAKELDRLQAGGCARDQGTTQYCAEAARLAAENERLRAAAQAIVDFHNGPLEAKRPDVFQILMSRLDAALKEEKTDD